MQDIRWTANRMRGRASERLSLMSPARVRSARAFHESFPQYAPTPLTPLPALADRLGLGGLHVKDESLRFGLNAFKVLGGAYAMGRFIAAQTGRDIADAGWAYLTGDALRRDFGTATFFTATDGNHGRGVAWAARQLGQRAVVRMPRGSARARLDAIAAEGAQVTIEPCNYDDCVRMAAAEAARTPRGVLVQDTAWDGYEEIPAWIMQGYGTMAMEAAGQLRGLGVPRPTHILIQAGVGSLAGAVVGFFAGLFPEDPPVTAVLEARAADCLYRSALAGDGAPRRVGGDLDTVMAGLACGEANPIAWDILRARADFFVSCPDWVAALGMRVLGAPLAGDARVVSGESGAVGAGLLAALLRDGAGDGLLHALGLNGESRVLLFSTEGATDPAGYLRAVWDGALPRYR